MEAEVKIKVNHDEIDIAINKLKHLLELKEKLNKTDSKEDFLFDSICEQCRERFKSIRKRQRFCSLKCRKDW